MQPGHADAYFPQLKIKFTQGHSPELTLRDDNGKIIETIDLTSYKTSEIHDLLVEKGLARNIVGKKNIE